MPDRKSAYTGRLRSSAHCIKLHWVLFVPRIAEVSGLRVSEKVREKRQKRQKPPGVKSVRRSILL
jgi:hypothetical protein